MKITIVEDHEMFREVLRRICVQELRHHIVGEAADGRSAVRMVLATSPHLLLLDLHLPNLDGFGVLTAVQMALPSLRVLVLSSHCDDYTVFHAERAGVHGFVDKNTNTVANLKKAITAVGEGGRYFSEEFRRIKATRQGDPFSFDKVLTDRERIVLALIGEPMDDREIGMQLGLSAETAEKHRFNIQHKLDLHGRVELVRYAQDHGFTLAARWRADAASPS